MNSQKRYMNFAHAPDVLERETSDNGFSKGWGMHFPTSESYWLDCHTHYGRQYTSEANYDMHYMLEEWFSRLRAYRLGGIITIIKDCSMINVCQHLSALYQHFHWLLWMPCDRPDHGIMQQAIESGASGLKLHNNAIFNGEADPDVWLSNKWAKVFAVMEQTELPVLWHMTQRVSASPYHGGLPGRPSLCSNEKALASVLKVIRRYPRIPFVGAHQIYLGPERLADLFQTYKNLYIDTSIGFALRWADELHNRDKIILRAFFTKYADRIIFGSDSALTGKLDDYLAQGFLCHPRFILRLNLPDKVLQNIAHCNAERLFKIAPLPITRRGNFMP